MKIKHLAIALIIFVFLTVFMQFGSAVITRGSPFFSLSQASFGKGQIIDGNLNFSLVNEPGNRIASARIPSIASVNSTLLEFLQNAGAVKTCNILNCEITYSANNPSIEKNLILNSGEKYAAFRIQGNNVEILNLSFSLNGSSSGNAVCGDSPLKIDLLNDEIFDFEYKKTGDWCSDLKPSECFSLGSAAEESILTEIPYCERIRLKKTAKIEASAKLKLRTGEANDDDLMFFVSDLDGNIKGNCIVGYFDSSAYSDVGCIIEAYLEKEDYHYVCVNTSSASEYVIKRESQQPLCGSYGSEQNSADYAIYAREAKFAPFSEEAVFNNETSSNNELINYIQNYIDEKYSGNCSNMCIIPVKIISLAKQNLTLNNLNLRFQTSGGPTYSDRIYDLQVNYPLINMTMQALPFRAFNLTLPESIAKRNYTIYTSVATLSANVIFGIEDVPEIISLSPTAVLPNSLTRFIVSVNSHNKTIVEYGWYFGDGAYETTLLPSVSHSYTLGIHTLTIKAKDNNGLIGSRSFIINSNLTKEDVNRTINIIIENLNDFNLQYQADSWYKDLFDLNISELNQTLNTLKERINQAETEELVNIKQQIDEMNIPVSFSDTPLILESKYIPNIENIGLDYVQNYNESLKVQYRNAVASWLENNVDFRISENAKTIVFKTASQDVSLIKLKIQPKTSLNDVFLIVQLPAGISYSDIRIKDVSDFDVSEEENAARFEFDELSEQEIEIAVEGRQDISQMTVFASPSFDKFNIASFKTDEKKTPYTLAGFLSVLILIAVLTAILLIWRTYNKNAESKLFKNPMDLYVLINYITASKSKGISKNKINEQLVKSKWTRQQIKYAWKKVDESKP